jgi:hypothetical protein
MPKLRSSFSTNVPDLLIADKMLCSLPVAAPSTSASRAHAHGGEREPSDVHQYPPLDQHADCGCVLNERARPADRPAADKMLCSLPVAAPSTSASRAHAHGGERLEPSDVIMFISIHR